MVFSLFISMIQFLNATQEKLEETAKAVLKETEEYFNSSFGEINKKIMIEEVVKVFQEHKNNFKKDLKETEKYEDTKEEIFKLLDETVYFQSENKKEEVNPSKEESEEKGFFDFIQAVEPIFIENKQKIREKIEKLPKSDEKEKFIGAYNKYSKEIGNSCNEISKKILTILKDNLFEDCHFRKLCKRLEEINDNLHDFLEEEMEKEKEENKHGLVDEVEISVK